MSNPTTGEWTPEFLDSMGIDGEQGRRLICKLHNAALDAEREVGGNTAIALAQQITKLEDQLAAAVEALKTLKDLSIEEHISEYIDAALKKVSNCNEK